MPRACCPISITNPNGQWAYVSPELTGGRALGGRCSSSSKNVDLTPCCEIQMQNGMGPDRPCIAVCCNGLSKQSKSCKTHEGILEIDKLGMTMMQRSNSGSSETRDRRFRSHFGVTPEICGHIWDALLDLPKAAEKMHLLWGLMFLMLYGTESVNASMAGGVDESTFRNWSWFFVEAIS